MLHATVGVPPSDVDLPQSFDAMRSQAIENTIVALQGGEMLIEVNFPPIPNMATAALNQLLDANRAYAKLLLQALHVRLCLASSRFSKLYAVFPDNAEANLARKAYGSDVPFLLSSIEQLSAQLKQKEQPKDGDEQGKAVLVLVQPGFNVEEYIKMEGLEVLGMPIVTLNGDLDKVRSPAYYPRIFYPKLHQARRRFFCRFKEAYYVKLFSNGGVLFKLYLSSWKLFYSGKKGTEQIWQGDERPEFRDVEKQLSLAKEKDLLS